MYLLFIFMSSANISNLDILNKIKSFESNINNPGLRKANITDITKNINKKSRW